MSVPAVRRGSSGRVQRRSEPFHDLEELYEQMGQLVQSVWPDVGDGQVWTPLVDVEETEDAWIVEAELPGVRREDVNVELRDNELAINGEIKERVREGLLRRRTRRVGRFEYRVTLPGQVDAERMEAKLKDGVLNIRIPKPEQARPRRIEVQGE